jgi:hypothetical protein
MIDHFQFARGGVAKASSSQKSGSLGQAIAQVVTGQGTGTGFNGTINGKKGFAVGNTYGKGRKPGSAVSAASTRHRVARNVVAKHAKAGTLNSKAGHAAIREAAHASNEVHVAKQAQVAAKSADAKADRAVKSGRAELLTAKPSPMAARVADSVAKLAVSKTDRAHQHLANLHERLKAGTVAGTDIHAHVDLIAKGATKPELFEAAKKAGVDTKGLKTKTALVEHLKANAATHMKPGAAKHEAIKATSTSTAHTMPLKDFAAKAVAAAHASPTGGFGDSKTFISHAHEHLQKTDPAFQGMSLDAFKGRLLEANQANHVDLGRADLPHAMNPLDVEQSTLPHGKVDYHFIRHPAKKEGTHA